LLPGDVRVGMSSVISHRVVLHRYRAAPPVVWGAGGPRSKCGVIIHTWLHTHNGLLDWWQEFYTCYDIWKVINVFVVVSGLKGTGYCANSEPLQILLLTMIYWNKTNITQIQINFEHRFGYIPIGKKLLY